MDRLSAGLLLLLVSAAWAGAQTVSTVLPPGSSLSDGIAVDSRGAVYVSAVTADRVHVVELDGSRRVLDHRFAGPTGLAFDAGDNLYVANEEGDYISKVTPDGEVSRFVDPIDTPGGLAFGADGTLYVTLKEEDAIGKVAPDGQLEIMPNAGAIDRPVGIVVTADGTLYVSSIVDGGIHRVDPDGGVERIADIPFTPTALAVSFLALVDGKLYAAAISDHFIYQVDLDGAFRVFAGTGANGRVDGPAATAQFNGPHGIAYNPHDNALYVSDFNTKALRRIALPAATAVEAVSWGRVKTD